MIPFLKKQLEKENSAAVQDRLIRFLKDLEG